MIANRLLLSAIVTAITATGCGAGGGGAGAGSSPQPTCSPKAGGTPVPVGACGGVPPSPPSVPGSPGGSGTTLYFKVASSGMVTANRTSACCGSTLVLSGSGTVAYTEGLLAPLTHNANLSTAAGSTATFTSDNDITFRAQQYTVTVGGTTYACALPEQTSTGPGIAVNLTVSGGAVHAVWEVNGPTVGSLRGGGGGSFCSGAEADPDEAAMLDSILGQDYPLSDFKGSTMTLSINKTWPYNNLGGPGKQDSGQVNWALSMMLQRTDSTGRNL